MFNRLIVAVFNRLDVDMNFSANLILRNMP